MTRKNLTRKFGAVKRMINPNDQRVKQKALESQQAELNKSKVLDGPPASKKRKREEESDLHQVDETTSTMFFSHNMALGPPYHVLVDTNFINFSIQNKLDVFQSMMDCLLAKCTPYLTDCVMGELEKLGPRFRVALKIARDPRFERLKCTHKGTYADDCLVERVKMHKCYIVASCDRDLRRRLRKVPGVPIMYVGKKQYKIERLPTAFGALK